MKLSVSASGANPALFISVETFVEFIIYAVNLQLLPIEPEAIKAIDDAKEKYNAITVLTINIIFNGI